MKKLMVLTEYCYEGNCNSVDEKGRPCKVMYFFEGCEFTIDGHAHCAEIMLRHEKEGNYEYPFYIETVCEVDDRIEEKINNEFKIIEDFGNEEGKKFSEGKNHEIAKYYKLKREFKERWIKKFYEFKKGNFITIAVGAIAGQDSEEIIKKEDVEKNKNILVESFNYFNKEYGKLCHVYQVDNTGKVIRSNNDKAVEANNNKNRIAGF